jgi:hypothetical protein
MDHLPKLPPDLKIEARQEARKLALDALMPMPKLSNYGHVAHERFGPRVFWTIVVIMALLFIVGFVPSAMRVYYIASNNFAEGSGGDLEGIVNMPLVRQVHKSSLAGVSFVIMAEIATLAFVIASRVLDGLSDWFRRGMYAIAGLAAFVAIIGNLQVTLDYNPDKMLDWLVLFFKSFLYEPFLALEATTPPVFTLFGGLLLGHLILNNIEARRAQLNAYMKDMEKRQELSLTIESSDEFFKQHQLAIWDKYQGRFRRLKAFQEIEWTTALRKQLIAREIADDTIMSRAELEALVARRVDEVVSPPLSVASLRQSTNGQEMEDLTGQINS